jgi:hypothetical protein
LLLDLAVEVADGTQPALLSVDANPGDVGIQKDSADIPTTLQLTARNLPSSSSHLLSTPSPDIESFSMPNFRWNDGEDAPALMMFISLSDRLNLSKQFKLCSLKSRDDSEKPDGTPAVVQKFVIPG